MMRCRRIVAHKGRHIIKVAQTQRGRRGAAQGARQAANANVGAGAAAPRAGKAVRGGVR